jgi:hypothetical protein
MIERPGIVFFHFGPTQMMTIFVRRYDVLKLGSAILNKALNGRAVANLYELARMSGPWIIGYKTIAQGIDRARRRACAAEYACKNHKIDIAIMITIIVIEVNNLIDLEKHVFNKLFRYEVVRGVQIQI